MRVRTPLDLGLLVRDRRKHLKMDQRTLAGHVGVNRQWVIDLEKGRPGAALGLVLRALNVLDLRLDLGPADGGRAATRTTGLPDVDLDAIIDKARGGPR